MKTIEEDVERQKNVRRKLMEATSSLLLGPGSECLNEDNLNEIISDKPEARYVTGILYPVGRISNSKESTSDNDLDELDDETITFDNSLLPSSMGMTFYFKSNLTDLELNVEYSNYVKITNPNVFIGKDIYFLLNRQIEKFIHKEKLQKLLVMDGGKYEIRAVLESVEERSIFKEFINSNDKIEFKKLRFYLWKSYEAANKNNDYYQRSPHQFKMKVPLREGYHKQKISPLDEGFLEIISNVNKISELSEFDIFSLTIILKNTSGKKVFQPKIQITANDLFEFFPVEDVKLPSLNKLSKEDQKNYFLYKNKKSYAVGHGVSVIWGESKGSFAIETTYIPTYEILPMRFDIPGLSEEILRPDTYLGTNKEEQINNLLEFVSLYDAWIDKLSEKLEKIEDHFKDVAQENLNNCRCSSQRMRKTIDFLQNNEAAWTAFQYANEAMVLQRIKDGKLKEMLYQTKDYDSVDFKWRPFQLAFVLNSLESILNDESDERNELDLIWVSTGGGKTEAYLFAIAAVIFFRKLTRTNSSGVSVIMRYTLRLLTSQQFDRAAALICALEYIRRNNENLFGNEEISVGLWVGMDQTKNHFEDANENLRDMFKCNSLEDAKKKNMFQILKCPWCNGEYSVIPELRNIKIPRRWGYKEITKTSKNLHSICCVNKSCSFRSGIPVYMIDEAIYMVRPTLLFGTVDKFAQASLKQETVKLFGSDNPEKYRRPELIIQDELHLISGPLGSIVGLYESGFDYIFSQNKGVKPPKYIASTATIRNAEEQVQNIFNRKVFQFPPSGFDSNDSFFVREDDKQSGRMYMGIMATGKSQMTTEIRLIAILLQSIAELGLSDDEMELFWTLTGYFNSIRELGKASSLIRDDVKDYLQQLQNRNGTNKRALYDENNIELTSRVSGAEIPDKIRQIESKRGEKGAVDTLIATNMLSVGVDIGRLNSMFVVGQPKLTSEYIQATSRVGRETLGLVSMLYNSTRSRDRSHYETFQSYHQNLYKYVEPSSVTPFSVPAVKKAAYATIVAMVRNTVPDLINDDAASKILEHTDILNMVKEFIFERIRNIDTQSGLYYEDATQLINNFFEEWKRLASEAFENNQKLYYYASPYKSTRIEDLILLRAFDDKSTHDESIRVMGTMRNVEESSFMEIIE
ncbi:DNA helicase [Vagococcus sp. BWB3-3]|uniref:DNA helicase n=1 Tax=Vagococcus allomyrinae TaxID=2794353 RepID=A0A940PCP6_9ENTE|nr:helicase-related protein [Vagococcus allomyrinae]MBP1042385.1 DNA helicase [Vagococcus allomyrinae]